MCVHVCALSNTNCWGRVGVVGGTRSREKSQEGVAKPPARDRGHWTKETPAL